MRHSTLFYCLLFSAASQIHSVNATEPSRAKDTGASPTNTEMIETTLDQNPLLEKWTGPNGGVPPFDKIKIADFKPGLEAAMEENLAEIIRIANDPAAPTFENTIAAMERSGKTLDRAQTIYGIWSSSMNNDEFSAVENEMEPKLAAFSDKILSLIHISEPTRPY